MSSTRGYGAGRQRSNGKMTQLRKRRPRTEDGGLKQSTEDSKAEIRGQTSDVGRVSIINGSSRPCQRSADESAQSLIINLNSLRVALLTGGGDKPYALGMAAALTSAGIHVDFIGSDDLSVPELLTNPRLNFLNLRGDQRGDASPMAKVLRVLKYYVRLIGYAATAKPKLFHILWNNKFQLFDRTVLMLYYRLLGQTRRVHSPQRECG